MNDNKEDLRGNEIGDVYVLIDANKDGTVNDMALKGGANQLLSCAFAIIKEVAEEIGDDPSELLETMLNLNNRKKEGKL